MIRAHAAIVFILIALVCGSAPAQPDRPRRDPPSPIAPPDIEKPELRDRLERMREFASRILEKTDAALQQLDGGADPSEVVRSIRTPEMRDRLRARDARRLADDQGGDASLGPEQLERVRAFIADELPGVDEPLSRVERLGPDAGQRLLRRLAPRVLDILDTREDDPELAGSMLTELRAGLEFVESMRRYRQALRAGIEDGGELDAIEQEIRDAARTRFDAQVLIKKHEINQLMARLSSLSGALDELITQRDERIDAQVDSATRLPLRGRMNRPSRAPDGSGEPDPSDD